jgi:arylsulfatase A-like enzyme
VFIACGPGIRAGASHAPLSILDVAPTLLYSLGLPIPSDLEGQVPVGIFDTSYLRTDPPRKGAPTHATLYVPDENAPANRERDAEIIERLKALGYL